MAILVVLTAGILFVALWGMTTYFSNKVEEKNGLQRNGNSAEELLKYRTIDEMVSRLQDLADSGEVNYFSMSDIRKIANEMKGIK